MSPTAAATAGSGGRTSWVSASTPVVAKTAARSYAVVRRGEPGRALVAEKRVASLEGALRAHDRASEGITV